jgi:prepilin-type N-terminal cleavage/methylation domain-containing protein
MARFGNQRGYTFIELVVAMAVFATGIDYGFYAANASNPNCSIAGRKMLALFVSDASSSDPKRVFYFYSDDTTTAAADGNTLFSVTNTNLSVVPTCAEVTGSPSKAKQVADNVFLTDLQFFVLPVRDPTNTSETDPVIRNTHPRVTIIWRASSSLTPPANSAQQSQYDETRLETTVSTRSYPINAPVGQ